MPSIFNKILECIVELIAGRPPRDKRYRDKNKAKKGSFIYNLV